MKLEAVSWLSSHVSNKRLRSPCASRRRGRRHWFIPLVLSMSSELCLPWTKLLWNLTFPIITTFTLSNLFFNYRQEKEPLGPEEKQRRDVPSEIHLAEVRPQLTLVRRGGQLLSKRCWLNHKREYQSSSQVSVRLSPVSQTVRPCLWRIKITHPAVPLLRLCWGTEQTLVCDESEGAAARAPAALQAFLILLFCFCCFSLNNSCSGDSQCYSE